MILVVRTLLAMLAAGMIALATLGADSAPESAGRPGGTDVAILPTPHIHLGERHAPYDSVPPTSGPHHPDTVGTGVYREELREEIQVHVLEHGHVLVQYAPQLGAAEVRELERLGRRYPRDVVVAPYRRLASLARRGRPIALTAWARIDRLASADERRISAFVRAYGGRYDHGEWRGADRPASRRLGRPR